MRGWLELTFLNEPKAAFEHFQELYKNVGYPISLSRGAYWSARAAEAMGQKEEAIKWYEEAANYPTTFYGQLAYSKRYPGQPLTIKPYSSSASASYTNDSRYTLSMLLLENGLSRAAAPLLHSLTEEAQEKDTLPALLQSFIDDKHPYAQTLAAKYALRDNNILWPDGWPKVIPPDNIPVEVGLLHAISRQESEFNPHAISSADARGLMQLLPSTARKTAQMVGLPYEESKLFHPSYNMQLGSYYLGDLVDRFDGNYILAIAGYNAGPGRSVQWVDRFGRPGKRLDQTITFMELIPFGETRNYVQRVLENLQVYRHLFNQNEPLAIEKDLMR